MNQLTFRITNITCEACVKMCTLLLKKLPGVIDVAIDQSSGFATVQANSLLTYEVVKQTLGHRNYSITEAV